jgi:Lon protease-like protein
MADPFPMFPLGTVLLPHMVLPLHVFEPRYRRMVADVLAGDGEFGVVLIERGSEVGGGDVRTGVGTVARVVRAEELPDGRYGLAAVGVRRIRVERWLPDDPYPRAEVVDWPDEDEDGPDEHGHGEDGPAEADDAAGGPRPADDPSREDRRRTLQSLVRRAAALRTELGDPAPPVDLELVEEPPIAVYQAMLAAGVGPADLQTLLAAPTLADRAARLEALLREQIDVSEARLGGP